MISQMPNQKSKIPIAELRAFAKQVPNPVFVALSGSHAYGFPSPDSDYDLRGAYVARTKDMLSLSKPHETIERHDGKIELVVHEAEKFLGMLLGPSGYILEQIHSPYPILETAQLKRLKLLSKNVICKALHQHYSGFALNVYKKARAASWADVKEDLYLVRILMTGITMLETGKIVVNLPEMNKKFGCDVVTQLIDLKAQTETTRGMVNLDKESAELFSRLDEAYKNSNLPDKIDHMDKFNDWLLKLRMANMK